ncbi:unnamed protein product [Ectocarpus sp. 6 AP-2014]
MFMDPSAFEAEDIERELRDAGLEPETTADAASGFRQTESGNEGPLLIPGKANRASPSSGSSFGLGSAGERGSSSGGGGEGGVWEQHKKQHQPRALKQNADGSSRQRQAVPTFGRHGKGKSGGGPRSSGQGRSQLSPISPKPSMGSSSPLTGGSSFAFGDNGDDGSRGDGDEGKFEDDARESGGSSATGVRSRARVLAQQREIQQRKRRQQALSSGGIRASDAASLSRGLVSSGASSHRRPSLNIVHAGDGGGPEHPSSGDGDQGPEDSLLDGNEEPYNSFSPSVKQFSAPRQVEGDAYTAFNSNDPRHAAAGRMSGGGMSEFEQRRSIGQIGLSDSEDEEGDRDDDAAFGRGQRRRNKKKAAPDMGPRSSDEGSGSASPNTPAEESRRQAKHRFSPFSRGTKPGHPRDEESRLNKSKPGDWDDRNRPSTKSYKWEGRDSGDEQSDDQDRGNGTGRAAWRSVGREENSDRSPPRSHNASRHSGKPRHLDVERSGDRSGHRGRRHPDSDGTGPDEEEGSGASSESSRSYISSSCSSSRDSTVNNRRARRASNNESRRRRRHHRRGGGGSSSGGGGGGGGGEGSGSSFSASRSSSSVSDRSSGASDGEGGVGKRRGRGRRSPPRRRYYSGDEERGGRESSRGKRGGGGDAGGGRRHPSSSSRARDGGGNASRAEGRDRDAAGSSVEGGGRHRRSNDSGTMSDQRDGNNDDGDNRSSSNRRAREKAKPSKGGNTKNTRDGQEQSDERFDKRGGGGAGEEGEGEKKSEEKDEGVQEAKSNGGGDGGGKRGVGEAAAVAGGGAGGGGARAPRDGIAATPSAAVVGAGVSGGGEMEFNMAALDLSDMKRFLLSPCPRAAGVVQCYIRRNKTRANKIFPEYTLFLKEGDRFLMCSKKRPNNATSNYLVSMRAGDLDRNSTNFLGKLRANFVGTEFQVFDDGYSPKELGGGGGWGSGNYGGGSGGSGSSGAKNMSLREELGCVMYASNVLGSRGPRKMQVAIPAVNEAGEVCKWSGLEGGRGSQTAGGGSKAIERVKNRDYDGSLYMVNKPPRWNDQVGAYVLNFYGRVTMASVKNFQLVSTEDFDRIILQFGRVAREEFTMDFQYPISPFQAFAITLSSFDSKIACD